MKHKNLRCQNFLKFSCINKISKFFKSYSKIKNTFHIFPSESRTLTILCYFSSIFFYIFFQTIPILSHFHRLSTHGYFVKVTAKKGKKAVSKTLKANVKVIGAGLKFTTDSTKVTVGSETKLAVKVCPSTANVTYKSADETIATVAADGTVKGVKVGEVKITATSDYGKTVETTVTVTDDAATKIDSVTATSVKTFEVKFDGIVKDSATGKFKITRAGTEVAMTAKWAENNKSATFIIGDATVKILTVKL